MKLSEAISALKAFKKQNPSANKATLEAFFGDKTKLSKSRSVFLGKDYAFRFSEANTSSFSNVVLSLSTLKKYDNLPVVVCIVRQDRLDFRLCNATFVKKIGHSSHNFTPAKIRGSFLGHDILDEFEGIPNREDRFEELVALHAGYSWDDNVSRLAESTSAIVPRSMRFEADGAHLDFIHSAPARAREALLAPGYKLAETTLTNLVTKNSANLLRAAAASDNVNLRGNELERILTGATTAHRLDDIAYQLGGGRLVVDIKTKLLDRASAPKAYNIDRTLALLAQPGTVFAFFFVGLNISRGTVSSRLASLFDPTIIRATRVQMHWSSASGRGATQLTGDLAPLFAPTYVASVDLDGGTKMLQSFLDR